MLILSFLPRLTYNLIQLCKKNNHKYTTNTSVPNYIKQILTGMKNEIKPNTVILGNLDTHCHKKTDELDRKSTVKY